MTGLNTNSSFKYWTVEDKTYKKKYENKKKRYHKMIWLYFLNEWKNAIKSPHSLKNSLLNKTSIVTDKKCIGVVFAHHEAVFTVIFHWRKKIDEQFQLSSNNYEFPSVLHLNGIPFVPRKINCYKFNLQPISVVERASNLSIKSPADY